MKRLIKDDDIILDGTLPRYEKEKNAFHKLGIIEELMEEFGIKDIFELRKAIERYKRTNYIRHMKNKDLEREVLALITSGHTRIYRRPPDYACPYSDPFIEVCIVIDHDFDNRNPEVLEWFKEKARKEHTAFLNQIKEMGRGKK